MNRGGGKMQRKIVKPKNLQFKITEDEDGTGYIEGYASVFGNIDTMNEVVQEGAFAKTLGENLQAGKVKFVDFHNSMRSSEDILGVVEEAEEDEHGLKFKARLSSTDRAQNVRTKIKEGILDALSIGYDVIQDEVEDNIRYLKELKLWEISVVSWGANPEAGVTGVKQDFTKQLEEITWRAKEGRVLSKRNYEKVQEAKQALEALLESAEPENSTQEDEKSPDKSNNKSGNRLLEEVKQMTNDIKKEKKIKELRKFAKTLRSDYSGRS